MSETKPSFFKRLHDRLFPKMPDFYAVLSDQSNRVAGTTGLLVEFMETGHASISDRVIQDEHEQDTLKVQNLQLLNEAFATPMDREDGLAANLVTALLVSVGAIVGLPMSTTHVSTGGIFAAGARRGSLRMRTLRSIGLAWVVTVPAAALLGIAIYSVTSQLTTSPALGAGASVAVQGAVR